MTAFSRVASVLLVTLVCVPPLVERARAQSDRAAALKEALAKNKAALGQYSWLETTDITLKGEQKKQEQKQCRYGADGKVIKTPVPGAAAPEPQQAEPSRRRGGGAVKKAVVSNKIDEMKDYMEKVKALVQQYVPPDPQKIQSVQAAGNLALAPSSDGATLTLKDYAKPGDSMVLGLDAKGTAIRSFSVKSYVEKPKDDDVTLSVTYAALPDGTSYPQRTVLDVAAKKIGVTVTNSGYQKAGS